MKFKMQHRFFKNLPEETFTEVNAPDWLTGVKTVHGSTMDCRWFWKEHVLTLKVGELIKTDFQTITRIE